MERKVHEKLEALSLEPNTHSEDGVERQNGTQTSTTLVERQNGMETTIAVDMGRNGMEATTGAYEGPRYSAAYIRTVEEGESTTSSLDTEADKLLEQYQLENPDSLVGGLNVVGSGGRRHNRGTKVKRAEGTKADTGGGEKYEKAVARHGDRTFLKFHKELSKCPQQIIRQVYSELPLIWTQKCGHPCILSTLKSP